MASSNQKEVTSKPYAVSTLDLSKSKNAFVDVAACMLDAAKLKV